MGQAAHRTPGNEPPPPRPEFSFAVKIRFARYRINGMHPEIVGMRVKMSQDDLARMKARERKIDEAEKRGRMGRRYR